MRDEKVFRLGRVRIDGDLIEFEAEPELSFAAGKRDQVSVGIAFEYREATEEKEIAAIRLTATLDGHPPETHEAVIQDNPVANDSRRGFISVPVRAVSGTHRGRFVVEARYGAGPWRGGPMENEVAERVEGTFVLDLR